MVYFSNFLTQINMLKFTEEEQKLMNLFIDVAVLEFLPKIVELTLDGETEVRILQKKDIHLSILESKFTYTIPNHLHEILFQSELPFYLSEDSYTKYKLFKKKQRNKNLKCPY